MDTTTKRGLVLTLVIGVVLAFAVQVLGDPTGASISNNTTESGPTISAATHEMVLRCVPDIHVRACRFRHGAQATAESQLHNSASNRDEDPIGDAQKWTSRLQCAHSALRR